MAQHWAAKAPTEVVRREWAVPVDDDDGLESISVTASSVTSDSDDVEGDTAVVYLSAGTTGTTGIVTITATTSQGRTLVETFYIPVVASTVVLGDTAQDYCAFALRKVFGRATAPSSAQEDALERLNAMLLSWRATGADVGATFPLLSATVLSVPDEYVEGIRANLILKVADRFGFEPAPQVRMDALRGLQLIKNKNVPDEREGADFY